MTLFAQLVIGGLSLGSVYALLALGFVVVYKSSGVVNFAHPALLMIGAYVIARLATAAFPFAVALLAGVAAAGAAAFVAERVLVRRMSSRSVIAVTIATLGVDVIVETEIVRRIGIDAYLPTHDPWGDRLVRLGAVVVPQSRIAALLVCTGFIAAFLVWQRRSRWGVAMRAVAEDAPTAGLMGIRRGTVSALAWTLAGVLAAVAGLFIIAFPSPGLQPLTASVALRAFPAAIIGGLDSVTGAIIGGAVVGLAEALAQGYASNLDFLGTGFAGVLPYVVMVAVLLVRPTGLFGVRELHRV
jgi:branched-chain amino acid transport system permease protein